MQASEEQTAATPPLTALSEDERMFQSTVRKFAREQIRPYVREMDEAGVFRKDIIQQFFEMGLMGIEIPEEYGGQGGTFFQAILAVEELSAVDPSAGVIVDVQNTICNNALLRWATRGAEGEVPAAAGGEHGGVAMRCRRPDRARTPSRWRRARRTRATTSCSPAASCGSPMRPKPGFFLLFANANPEAGYKGITAFLIEREFPGFQVGKKEDKLGLRASSTCELILDNCRVPRENVMGEVGKGYKIAIETLNEGRIAIGAQMIGLARGALDHAVAYAKERKQFGKPIGEFQGVQFELAKMAIEVEAARLLVYNAARLRDAGLPFLTEAAMAKYYSSEIAETGGVEGHRSSRRRRDYQGLSGGEALPRRQDRADLRRHQQHPTADHRQETVGQVRLVSRNEGNMRVIVVFGRIGGCCACPVWAAELRTTSTPDEIIQKFAAKEAEFRRRATTTPTARA